LDVVIISELAIFGCISQFWLVPFLAVAANIGFCHFWRALANFGFWLHWPILAGTIFGIISQFCQVPFLAALANFVWCHFWLW
jgi:hypothetical protein